MEKNMSKTKVTLLTGACGGLGQAFAKELLAKNEPMLLCGTNETRLQALKESLLNQRPDSLIYTFKLDLSSIENITDLSEYLKQNNLTISRLINNAGFITEGSIEASDTDNLLQAIRVNCEGTIALTKLVLSMRDGELKIITVASMAANYPMPYMAIYSATKAMLKSFMLSLRYEYRKENVKVTTVLPSAIATSDAMKSAIAAQGFKGKISCVSPEKIARKAIKANEHNKATLIPGGFNKFVNFISKLVPMKLQIRFIGSSWRKSQNKRDIK